ncbi:MAG: 2-oxoglutarate and iron-dependent oxygenase domain-containing protein [Ilumatobacteraceae bacterium]
MGLVPTIDLSSADAPSAIDRACREVGFFQIVGHGVDPAVEGAAWDAATEFFRLPLDDKMAVAIRTATRMATGRSPSSGWRRAAVSAPLPT